MLSAGAMLAGYPVARAQVAATLTTLHGFAESDGDAPLGKLVLGSDGNFYGTTGAGGASGSGTVFVITPAGTLTVLHSFDGSDGQEPYGGLVEGNDGNFYGTTTGLGELPENDTSGTVFKITPTGGFTNLHVFNGKDGAFPAGITLGKNGDVYGTTGDGGTKGYGTVYRLTPAGRFKTLYNFRGMEDGSDPLGALALGSDGNLYGTTYGGDFGTVFRITAAGTLTTLHTFNGSDGEGAAAGLVLGSDGNFYGETELGGDYDDGTVFRITPAGVLTTLHSFTWTDGDGPSNGLVFDRDGNLYGTTQDGGTTHVDASGGDFNPGDGTVFMITPAGVFTTLYNFGGTDGQVPSGGLVLGGNGSLFGTTEGGGASGYGSVYELTVSSRPAFFTGEAALTSGVYYLALPDGAPFGYYSFLSDPAYLYHFDLGYEYVFDAGDGMDGVYLYDFASGDFFYTSPGFPFPYLYDFDLSSVLYYYPDPTNAGHYTTGPRYFYDFATGQIITK